MIVLLMLDLLLQFAANPQRGQGFEMSTIVVAFPLNAGCPWLSMVIPTYPFIHGILMYFAETGTAHVSDHRF